MIRRRTVLAALPAALSAPALAQQRPRRAAKPPPLEPSKHPALPPPGKSDRGGESALAPIPDRSREAPRVVEQDRPRLNPSIINRNMPGRGQAAEGSPDLLEEKLFKPAPGIGNPERVTSSSAGSPSTAPTRSTARARSSVLAHTASGGC